MNPQALFIQNIIGGISIGGLYALVALGFALVYRAMGLVNFAHGSIFMLGTYLGVIFYMGLYGLRLPFGLAFAVGVALTALFGFLLERLLRPLARLNMVYMLTGTIGVGIVLDNLAILLWGAEGMAVPPPIRNEPWIIGGVRVLPYMVFALVAAVAIMAALHLFMNRTRWGRAMRAAAQDREIAAAMGIHVDRMNALSLAIGSGLAAAAGILAAPIIYVNPALAAAMGAKGFAATSLGGFGNLPGAIVGGLIFGVLEAFSANFISSAYKNAPTYLLLVLVLVLRPKGLLGDDEVEKV